MSAESQTGADTKPDEQAQPASGKRKVRQGRPRFVGVTTYQDPLGRFWFRYPSDWRVYDLTDDREGVMFAPNEADNVPNEENPSPKTYFAAWVSKLGEHVVAEDLPVLQEGLEAGLKQLPGVEVEKAKDDVFGNLVKLERIYEFDDGGERRKRRTWTLYVDYWQIVLVFQGETPEEYKYWLPMGNYSFATFNIPEELWFATDRDLRPYD
ncbi:MAG TPA: hypothetical protein VIL34_09310 [Actinopolymorphaceae bacterium]